MLLYVAFLLGCAQLQHILCGLQLEIGVADLPSEHPPQRYYFT